MKTKLISLLASFLLLPSAFAAPPNIIIFLADDLGYADIGANGCQDIPTPNIDSIAESGGHRIQTAGDGLPSPRHRAGGSKSGWSFSSNSCG